MVLLNNIPQHTVGEMPEFLGGVRKLIKTTYKFNETSLKMKPIIINSSRNSNTINSNNSNSTSPLKLKMIHSSKKNLFISN